MSGIWDFLNKPLSVLLLGFLLTTISGGALAAWFRQRNWKRQARLALFQKRYDEGATFLDALSDLVGKRYFLLQRYLWSVEDPVAYDTQACANEYFACVKEWNTRLRTTRNKARLLIGEERALQLLDYQDDNRPTNPKSLHYIFVKAHRAVQASKANKNLINEASNEVEQLNFICSRPLEEFTTEFLRRAQQIQLVELPVTAEDKSSRR